VHAERDRRPRAGRQPGYWIAAAEPLAAYEAVFRSYPLGLRRAALLTDGASSAVEDYGLVDWLGLLDLLDTYGPQHLIALVRQAEREDPDGSRRPRYKVHDDATAVICRFDA